MAFGANKSGRFGLINLKRKKAFSLLEVILAMGLFVVFSTGAIIALISGLSLNQLGEEQTIANQYATEGIEAVRSMRNRDYNLLANSAGTGVTRSANLWAFSGVNNTFDKYTRVVAVNDVNRDGSGNVVSVGGSLDPLTKKVTSTVSWNVTASRPNSVILSTYFTNFKKSILGNWATPLIESSLNFTGNGSIAAVAVANNYAYVARSSGNPNFMVIDYANLAAPAIVGSLNLSPALNNIFISGNYAYISSGSNSQELQIVNISNPAAPVLVGSFNAAGNADATAVYVVGTKAYLTRLSSADPEFYTINVTNPAAPTQISTNQMAGDIKDVVVIGNYTYAASTFDSNELQVLDMTNPASPVLGGALNLSGTSDAISITGFAGNLVIGRTGGEIDTINISSPLAPVFLNSINIGGNVNDLALGNNNTYIFAATANAAAEFSVVDISTIASPVSLGLLDLAAGQTGVAYDSIVDRAFTVGLNNNPEFYLLKPS